MRGNFLTGDSKKPIGMEEEYDARFKEMGEASRFILTVRVEEINRGNAEAVLGRIGGQTIDSVSAAKPSVSDD